MTEHTLTVAEEQHTELDIVRERVLAFEDEKRHEGISDSSWLHSA
ncbi:hypothetical protein [Halocatena marina]|uniref:Uncharacterized protein n=1 Tax=Halocatena marina TaxID=2934937 RepID=A0ABD5YXZ8_9EURY|nr:hypothetical protein [Halocatena marina]